MKGFNGYDFEELVDEFASRVVWNEYGRPGMYPARTELLRRYELAQRARARNLVRAMTDRRIRVYHDDTEWTYYPSEHKRPRFLNWLEITADRIAAKYLGGKS